jgi:hypothetical protein
MIRSFLVLAVTGATLLVADSVLGVFASSEIRGPHAIWHAIHLLFSLLTVVVLLGIHSIVYTYFMATGKWAKEVVRVYGLPQWFVSQATRNKRRTFRFVLGSMTAIAFTAWLGAAADTQSSAYTPWHLGVAALSIAFNLGSFGVEYIAIVSHARLLLELKSQADALRAVRCGSASTRGASVEA